MRCWCGAEEPEGDHETSGKLVAFWIEHFDCIPTRVVEVILARTGQTGLHGLPPIAAAEAWKHELGSLNLIGKFIAPLPVE